MQVYIQDNNETYPLAFQWQPAIHPYLKNKKVFRCPALPANFPDQTDYVFDFSRLNVFLPPYPTKNIRGIQESAIVDPTSVITVGESGAVTADGVSWYVSNRPLKSCGGMIGNSTIHFGGSNKAFADGHVQWMTPERASQIDCTNGPAPAPFSAGT